ncbi:membrane protein [Pontibacter sp. HJ8]
MEEVAAPAPLITNDAVVLGILVVILAIIFKTSSSERRVFKKFYSVVPALLLCYLIPSLLNSLHIISGEHSNLYHVASRYLLPASLVLFTVSLDLKEIWKLRHKAGLMFITGSVGIVIGGPLAILIVSTFAPEIVGGQGPDAVWRGLSTIAGSWIGGGANQLAMYEVFKPNPNLFSAVIAVDVIVANIWMAVLLYGAGRSDKLDAFFKADNSTVNELKEKVERYRKSIMKLPTLADTIMVVGVGLGVTGLAHFLADIIAPWIELHAPYLEQFSLTSGFFWIVVLATTFGMLLSLTSARKLEGVGASRIGSLFLYIMVATIGMQMDVAAIFSQPGLFLVGIIWISIHFLLLVIVGKLVKAPFFFLAVGSQANVGGAASAPIVASAFHPALAPVGVLLAILGYALGTYGAYLSALLMQMVAPQ